MRKPCDICLEEKCDGKHDCHCDTCSLKDKCYRKLHATIRITNKCTQECSHCCFASSPKSNIMMSIEKAKEIAKFFIVNSLHQLNLQDLLLMVTGLTILVLKQNLQHSFQFLERKYISVSQRINGIPISM